MGNFLFHVSCWSCLKDAHICWHRKLGQENIKGMLIGWDTHTLRHSDPHTHTNIHTDTHRMG